MNGDYTDREKGGSKIGHGGVAGVIEDWFRIF